MRLAFFVVALAVVVVSSGTSAASDELRLRGYGTPVVDGVLAPGEWDSAGHYDFQAKRAPAEGGGTVPATFYVMNDATNIYVALRVSVANLGYSAFDVAFHAPAPNAVGPGNDVLRTTPSSFEDMHYHFVPPFNYPWMADVQDGGTRDGAAVVRTHGDFSVFEVVHPLNSADDGHDFSLTIPRTVEFYGSFQHCVDTCVGSFVPGIGLAKIIVVSGTRVPPNTFITGGPPDRAEVRDEKTLEFTGTDDVGQLGGSHFRMQGGRRSRVERVREPARGSRSRRLAHASRPRGRRHAQCRSDARPAPLADRYEGAVETDREPAR